MTVGLRPSLCVSSSPCMALLETSPRPELHLWPRTVCSSLQRQGSPTGLEGPTERNWATVQLGNCPSDLRPIRSRRHWNTKKKHYLEQADLAGEASAYIQVGGSNTSRWGFRLYSGCRFQYQQVRLQTVFRLAVLIPADEASDCIQVGGSNTSRWGFRLHSGWRFQYQQVRLLTVFRLAVPIPVGETTNMTIVRRDLLRLSQPTAPINTCFHKFSRASPTKS